MARKAVSKEVQIKQLKDEREELEKKIEKREIDIQTAQLVNRADRRKIKEVEMRIFGLDQFFDMPRSGKDWKLYDVKNANNVSIKISKEFRNQLRWLREVKSENKRLAFREVIMYMENLMEKYKNVGASDTEPREVMICYAEKYAHRLGYDIKNAW